MPSYLTDDLEDDDETYGLVDELEVPCLRHYWSFRIDDPPRFDIELDELLDVEALYRDEPQILCATCVTGKCTWHCPFCQLGCYAVGGCDELREAVGNVYCDFCRMLEERRVPRSVDGEWDFIFARGKLGVPIDDQFRSFAASAWLRDIAPTQQGVGRCIQLWRDIGPFSSCKHEPRCRLPDEFIAYRGGHPDEAHNPSWTLDPEVARAFARKASHVHAEDRQGEVWQTTINRRDVLAYLGCDGHREVVVDPLRLTDLRSGTYSAEEIEATTGWEQLLPIEAKPFPEPTRRTRKRRRT